MQSKKSTRYLLYRLIRAIVSIKTYLCLFWACFYAGFYIHLIFFFILIAFEWHLVYSVAIKDRRGFGKYFYLLHYYKFLLFWEPHLSFGSWATCFTCWQILDACVCQVFDRKLNIFWFWTVGWAKQAHWMLHLEVCEITTGIFHICLTF